MKHLQNEYCLTTWQVIAIIISFCLDFCHLVQSIYAQDELLMSIKPNWLRSAHNVTHVSPTNFPQYLFVTFHVKFKFQSLYLSVTFIVETNTIILMIAFAERLLHLLPMLFNVIRYQWLDIFLRITHQTFVQQIARVWIHCTREQSSFNFLQRHQFSCMKFSLSTVNTKHLILLFQPYRWAVVEQRELLFFGGYMLVHAKISSDAHKRK